MIRLPTIPSPAELTDEVVQKLTSSYKTTGTEVWQQPYIRKALLEMSAGKCCYCETKLGEESKYLEVEHFHPKKYYPDEVVTWENLLPVCKRCNAHKSSHDTKREPIIHPVQDEPKTHLRLTNYFLKANTPLGKTTIEVVCLNDIDRLVTPRFRLGSQIIRELEELLDMVTNCDHYPAVKQRNQVVGKLTVLLSLGTRVAKYSATAATIILGEDSYHQTKQLLLKNNWWNEELTQLEKEVECCALSTTRL